MEYSGKNGTEFKTLLGSLAPYRSKTHYVKINIVNFKNQTIWLSIDMLII